MKKKVVSKKGKFKTPILFVHGAWHGAWCWKNFTAYFEKKGFSCHTMDLPCHGERRDEPGLAGKSMMDYVREVEAKAKEIGNPVIVAHSMGGFVAMKYLERKKAPAAVLVAPSTYRNLPRLTFIKIMIQYPIFALKFFLFIPLKVTSEKMYRHLFLYNAPKKVSQEGFKKVNRESSLALMGLGIPLTWLRPKKVKSKILLLASGHDYFFPERNERKTAKAYNASFRLYEDMGHNLMTETGWEKVADDIYDWLRKKVK
jgi:pimeloyl-ACP methyl ester carboxylesterase